MVRRAKPAVRSNGAITGVQNPTPGQPNGNAPRGAPQKAAVGVGTPEPYGRKGQLQQALKSTPAAPPPPGISDVAHAAAQTNYVPQMMGQVTPLNAPTQNPWEHVTAGAPLSAGPTNPMAQPMPADGNTVSVAAMLQQAAQASGSPALVALAARANATASATPSPSGQ